MTSPVSDTTTVTLEPTRNPDSVVFQLNKTLLPPGTGESYPDADSAKDHPLASALFKIRGVLSVWIIGSEVQISKEENVRWSRINSTIVQTIKQQVV